MSDISDVSDQVVTFTTQFHYLIDAREFDGFDVSNNFRYKNASKSFIYDSVIVDEINYPASIKPIDIVGHFDIQKDLVFNPLYEQKKLDSIRYLLVRF